MLIQAGFWTGNTSAWSRSYDHNRFPPPLRPFSLPPLICTSVRPAASIPPIPRARPQLDASFRDEAAGLQLQVGEWRKLHYLRVTRAAPEPVGDPAVAAIMHLFYDGADMAFLAKALATHMNYHFRLGACDLGGRGGPGTEGARAEPGGR